MPHISGLAIVLLPVRAVAAPSVPPLSTSVAGPKDVLLVAKNAPLYTFNVPDEVLSAITSVPPLGARFATGPEYVPLNTKAPPPTGE